MKTADWIARQAESIRAGERKSGKCATVWREGDTIYSYGRHYPLLYRVEGNQPLLVVNKRGYSMTTSRHISHASGSADVSVYASDVIPTLEGVRKHLCERVDQKRLEWQGLTRRNTQRAEGLLNEIARMESDIAKLV